MKKPIDPNLNNFSEDLFLESQSKTDAKNGDESSNSDFSVVENDAVDERDFHASEHHRAQAEQGTLNEQFVLNFSRKKRYRVPSESSNKKSKHHSSHHSHHSSSSSHHKSSHSGRRKHKLPLGVRILIVLLVIILLITSVFGGGFLYLMHSGKNSLVADPVSTEYNETIEYNGHTYVYDKNKVAFAFLGVDRNQLGTEKGTVIGNSGQADADVVIVVDTTTAKISLISIPRDTMVDVDLYSTYGVFAGTEEMQLCLAYAYGDGGETSCQNVLKSISRILYDVPIEKYFALDLDGIAPLNDAVGGVTLTSLYSFDSHGIKKGDIVTIKGDFAETYVRQRDLDDIEASLNRTSRQTQYIQAYTQQLRTAVADDFSVVTELYNLASKYSETNISLSDVTYLASLVVSKGISDYTQYSVDGEMKPSSTATEDVFAEFYADEDSVLDIVINCFYNQVS